VLLVEDDDSVRRLLRAALEGHGYRVFEAGRGDLAVSILEAASEPIDVLIADVILPQVSGYQLAHYARTLHPETEVIYMSGYLESEVVALSRGDSSAVFLQKPFRLDQILALVQKVLASRGRQANSH
jgi:DNA-binding NtrC family response regulator